MIVVDANVVFQLVAPGEDTDASVAVLRSDPDWVVPALCRSELRSVFAKYIRRDAVSVAEASAALDRVAAIVTERGDAVDSRAVLDLANRSGCSSYDCEYVALANALGTPLVTWDRAVLRAFPKTAVRPADFAA